MKRFKKFIVGAMLALSLAASPVNVQSKIKEKAIAYNAATGHNHNGEDKGRKISAHKVIFTSGAGLDGNTVFVALDELEVEKIPLTQKGVANGIASLSADGTVPMSQLNPLVITDVDTCVSEVCQLALVSLEGDVCIRTDENKAYIHNGGVAEDMTDWTELLATGYVLSVNGNVGVVTGMEETSDRQTVITDSDTNYPTSGAVVDYVAANPPTVAHIDTTGKTANDHHAESHAHTHASTTGRTVDDHHDDLSNGLNITPGSVSVTGGMAIDSDVSGAEALTFSGDVNLYRSAADVLKTDDHFVAAGQISVDSDDTGDRLYFGSAGDVSLYRPVAGQVKTDGHFVAAGQISVDSDDTGDRLYFGSAGDVSLGRLAANTLDIGAGDSFSVDTADHYAHGTTTKTQVYSPAGVVPDDVDGLSVNGYRSLPFSADNNWDSGYMALHLAPGVIVTKLEAWGATNDTDDQVNVFLYSIDFSGSSTSMAAAAFANGDDSASDIAINDATIVNTKSYYIFIQQKADDFTFHSVFYAARITYTTTDMSQTR